VVILFGLTTSIVLAQPYGKIFSKSEADQKFGSVLESVTLDINQFNNLLNQTNDYIMFRVLNGKLTVLDNKRNVLYPLGEKINSSDVFILFSVSVVNQLISVSSNSSISIEKRVSVLTVTYGEQTMEVGSFCPPYCSD
jgi:hypothetical protein